MNRSNTAPLFADVELTLRLEGSSIAFDRARVLWSPGDASEPDLSSMMDGSAGLFPDPTTGRFRFRAPAGPILVAVVPLLGKRGALLGVPVSVIQREFELVPGRNELSIELPRRADAVLVLRDGMRNVQFPDSARVEIESAGRRIDVGRGRTREGHCAIALPGPGRYRIRVTGIEGFEARPLEVDVGVCAREILLVPLQRLGAS
jgi:hypothetical protein